MAMLLPGPVQTWLERQAEDFLQPDGSAGFDFATPPGEPALAPHDGIAWRLFKNPLVLLVGGIAAVLLELAEPRIREGVWEHSRFRQDPLGRLQRTGLAAMITVYGARSKAEAMIAGVNRAHASITGTTPEGRAYRADDPELLLWVQATAAFAIIEAYARYVRPLRPAERDLAYVEGVEAAKLYGVESPPASRAEVDALFEAHRPLLAPTPIVFEFLAICARTPILPPLLRPLQRPLLKASVELLPPWVRQRLGLDRAWSLNPAERALVTTLARAADRIPLRTSPAAQASRRLGLADTALY